MPQADQAPGCPHPREVFDLIGHENIERDFAALYDADTLHHAWLLTGPKGIGKATLAYRMIRRVLGGVPQTVGQLDVPETDTVAKRIRSLGHGDFLLIRCPYDLKTKKLRSQILISEIRKVSQFFAKKASEGGWRVCLIDSADEMNPSATNALLKTLEEPPEKCLIILLSKTPGRLLPTIRSRCKTVNLRAVPKAQIKTWAQAITNSSADDIQNALTLAGGTPGMVLALLNHADDLLRPLQTFLASFPRPNTELVHRISDKLALVSANDSFDLFWEIMDRLISAQAIYTATGEWTLPGDPIAKQSTVSHWLDLQRAFKDMRGAQAGLNMNKKTVLLDALTRLSA